MSTLALTALEQHGGLAPDKSVPHTATMITAHLPRLAQPTGSLSALFTLALCLGAACFPPSRLPAGDPDAGVDAGLGAAYPGYGTCEPSQLTFGACVIGEQFSCSTWEHDHCGVCIAVHGEGRWVARGPHGLNCTDLAACSTAGERRALTQWNGPSLCCTCDAGGATLRWTCEAASSCP